MTRFLHALIIWVCTTGACPCQADGIDWVKVEPEAIPVDAPALITVTAQVVTKGSVNGGEPVYPTNVRLLRCPQGDAPCVDLGGMFDDGSHGDRLEGDSVFTTQVNLTEFMLTRDPFGYWRIISW